MILTDEQCYKALLSHDTRFDGRFFTCVSSTGIYCRPVCTAIVPKRRNCLFVASAAEAEQKGFRPCLRCRPEYAPKDQSSHAASLVDAMANYIDETLLIDETLGQMYTRFKVSDRHARRLFLQALGIEPKQYLTSRRLLFAKQLLQDTSLSIVDVAFAAGFNSRGRLTINMRQVYGFTPERLRKETERMAVQSIRLRTDYRPPFNWFALLDFLAGRATSAEWISDGSYHRIVNGHEIIVTNDATKNCLFIALPPQLTKQSYAIIQSVRRLCDLDANPLVIEAALSQDPLLKKLTQRYPGMRVAGCWDKFEMVLRVIVGQQVSVAAATTIMRRIVDTIGSTPAEIAASTPELIASMGMPLRRAQTIHMIGNLVQDGMLNLDERDPQLFYDQLVALPGIGPWTAEYLQMRVLGWPDAFPAGDLGLQKAIIPNSRISERKLRDQAARWRPWRSYATLLLWKSLENKGG